MIILIALLTLLSIGIYIFKKSYDYDTLGFIIAVCAEIYLVLHIFFWLLASYEYGVFVAKRQAFVETLNDARKNNNPIELAAITKNVSDWNQQLAVGKYNRTVFMLKDYTDKRVESLQPIR
jgi:uncharacterized protein YneF (UPF0154 family)